MALHLQQGIAGRKLYRPCSVSSGRTSLQMTSLSAADDHTNTAGSAVRKHFERMLRERPRSRRSGFLEGRELNAVIINGTVPVLVLKIEVIAHCLVSDICASNGEATAKFLHSQRNRSRQMAFTPTDKTDLTDKTAGDCFG